MSPTEPPTAGWLKGYRRFDVLDFFEKYGFGDGDIVDHLLRQIGVDLPPGRTAALESVVRRFVVPVWKDLFHERWPSWDIEIYTVPSIHNPVRAVLIQTDKNGKVRHHWQPPRFMRRYFEGRQLVQAPCGDIVANACVGPGGEYFFLLLQV